VSLHKDLLAQARHLCNREPKKPKQASLRRAISTAYYALFHCFIAGATATLVPSRHRSLRPLLGRAFTHKGMADACKRLINHAANPKAMTAFMGAVTCSPALLASADAFGELQQARHEADYNTARRFARSEAIELVELAESAVVAFDAALDDPHGVLLQLAFLDPNQMIRLGK
jgi:uncharacterized protein (UPF0332 family)